ncbi:hypothetical protein PHYPSEUDO_011555 [Phytophthora pseudosyringae]|uniref:Uncharacterized protein n=1 Tax=Phytophthora pseudosyringae TaxID=221518 RepID=A0A8T1W868_9STRA|nr:hypothetical protein PHYPSEUDO_011555 [Phytophthora pseudosyringae]
MADHEAGTPPSDNGTAIVSEQLTALLLKEDDTRVATTATRERRVSVSSFMIPPTPSPSLEAPSYLRGNGADTAPPSRRPLFSSMREALESSGQVKEEPGGYVIKRHSGRQQQYQQLRSAESAGRPKYRHAKQRSSSKGDSAAPSPVEDEADAAGYTVIRRRSSCDESSLHAPVAASHTQPAARRNPRASAASHANKKPQQQPKRPRRGSMSTLPQSSSLVASISPAPSSSVPPGFQPHFAALRPPPGLTPAASGWVAKAAAPAERASKIAEPPVEALWGELKSTAQADSGWAVTTTAASSSLQAQAWPAAAGAGASSSSASAMQEEGGDADDDDLLARLGVTL